MRYLSVCSGIEAATVAWHPLGWTPAAFSEIEPFPSAVLAHHYPDVTNVGDMTRYKEWNIGAVELLVGGTPCQSFSVAGLRRGLEDPRGNLALVYCGILDHLRPKWFVWENVPGVLSSNRGRDFGSFLGALAELGYGFAYRVLDAQYFGVAQRRRRVFVVGYLGDWRPAAEVLFEPESLRGDLAPSRKAGKRSAAGAESSTQRGSWWDGKQVAATLTTRSADQDMPDKANFQAVLQPVGVPDVMATLLSSTAGISRTGNAVTEHETYIPMAASFGIPGNWIGRKPENGGNAVEPMHDIAPCLTKTDKHGVAHPITFSSVLSSQGINPNLKVSQTLEAKNPMAVAQPIAWDEELNAKVNQAGTILRGGSGGRHDGVMQINMAVRRLTPVECERLQGFPDNYTAIPWRKGTAANCPDGPRYKALGNSMAVPVMRWIGERIKKVEEAMQ